MSTEVDLRLDAQELEQLLATATRGNNKALLEQHLVKIRAQIQQQASNNESLPATDDSSTAPPATVSSTTTATTAAANPNVAPAAATVIPPIPSGGEFVPIQTFGWDQSDKFVSVYISENMAGVKASGADVDCDFEEDSFDLKITGCVNLSTCRVIDPL